MHAPLPRTLAPFIVASLVLVIMACTVGGTFTPYYLPDTAPSALDVAVQMYVGGNTPSGYSTVVDVSFSVPGHVVSFREGETLACNGAAPVLLSSLPDGDVNQVPHGDLGGVIPSSAPIPRRDVRPSSRWQSPTRRRSSPPPRETCSRANTPCP